MKKTKIRKEKIFKYIIAFMIPVICIVAHMIMTNCYPFGKNSVLLGDSNTQYYAFYMELSDRIRNGKSLFFSWSMGLGYDFYSNFFYYLASPFNLIAVAFGGSHVEMGMIVTMCVQVGLCGVAMTYFLSHTSRNIMRQGLLNDMVCVVFGMAYSMCDYILAYQYNILWLICLLLVPLMMLGIEWLVEDGDVKPYFVILFLSLVFNFYFSWFVAIMAVVWFVDVRKENAAVFWRCLVRFVITSIVAALSACVVLVPCFLAILGREGESSVSVDVRFNSLGNLGSFFQSFFWGSNIDVTGRVLYGRNMYMGIALLFLAVVYMFNKKIRFLSRIKRLTEIGIMIISLNLAGAVFALHGFTYPHTFSCRYAFILVVLLIVSAFECVTNWVKPHIWEVAATGLIFSGLCVLVFLKNDETQSIVCYMATMMITIYLFMVYTLQARNSIKKKSLIMNFVIVLLVELTANSVYVNKDNYTTSMEKNGGIDYWGAMYGDMDDSDLNRKTSWVLSENNTAYSDTNIFTSIINNKVTWLFGSLGMVYQKHGATYAYRNTTPVTALMFNVKNVLSDTDAYYGGYSKGEKYRIEDKTYDIDKNIAWYTTKFATGLGFSSGYAIKNWDISNVDPFVVQNNFVKAVSGVDGVFTKVDASEFTDYDVKYMGSVSDKEPFTGGISLKRKSDTNAYSYINTSIGEGSYASQIYMFVVPRAMHLYVSLEDSNRFCSAVTVDGKIIEEIDKNASYAVPKGVLDLGNLKKGQKIEIQAVNLSSVLKKGVTFISFYEYHDDRMQECMVYVEDSSMVIESAKDTYIKGKVTAKQDGILYTSIPYYKGFTAYVDGKKTDITTLADGALIGVELTEGTHTVEFRYVPYGFKLGLILSFIGWGIAVIYMRHITPPPTP